MRIALALPAVLLLSAAGARSEVQVQVAGSRVSVRATSAPLSEVLDQIARQTGMKVVYESGAPRPLVTVFQERRTPAEAVLGVLEGLGLNYAVQMDATGTRVETLLLTAVTPQPAAAGAPGRSSPTFTPVVPPPIKPGPPPNVDEDEGDEPPEGMVPGVLPTPPPQPGVTPALVPGSVPPQPLPTTSPPPYAPVLAPPIYPNSPFAPRAPTPLTLPITPEPEPSPKPNPTPSPSPQS